LSVLVALTVGLVFWIVAWSLGAKAFDAFLVTVLLVVVAATARMVSPFMKQLLGRESASPSEQGVERI
jgi:Mn2+/Fe2+ NRAMP family transporter